MFTDQRKTTCPDTHRNPIQTLINAHQSTLPFVQHFNTDIKKYKEWGDKKRGKGGGVDGIKNKERGGEGLPYKTTKAYLQHITKVKN